MSQNIIGTVGLNAILQAVAIKNRKLKYLNIAGNSL